MVPREVIEKHLADRVRLYRLVKGICGIESETASSGKAASLVPGPGGGGGSWDDGVPVEYGDSGFWSAAWEPTIADYGISAAQNSWWENRASEIAARRAACLQSCNDACDVGSDFVGVTGCGAVGLGLMASGVGAFTGAAVLLACGTGAITGKYWCKWSTCPSNCGG